MIVVMLFTQLATTAPAVDSVYSSPAVRALVTAAAAENWRLTQLVPAFRARVESELAMVTQDSIDREITLFAQQHASSVEWKNGSFDVRVTAARPAVRRPDVPGWPGPAWLLPALYGERLPFVFYRNVEALDRRAAQRATVWDTLGVEHPFERERERRYIFSGGDTTATIHANGRTIPIVHLHVIPHFTADENGAAFEGDIYLDATRKQIVRLRGRFVRALSAGSRGDRVLRLTGTIIAPYVEVTNEEVGGEFWLPYVERVEFQFVSALMYGERGIWRFTATFADHVVDTTGAMQAADPIPTLPRPRVSYVSEDSLALPHEWTASLGTASHLVRATDFKDIAPPNWRDTGPAQFTMRPSRLSRLVHVDPVEGYFTGLEGTMNFRDAAPGLSVHGFGGWAWKEQTVRGGAGVAWRRDQRAVAIHAERRLESTNDFPLDIGVADPGLAELVGFAQQRDYVDRRAAALSLSDIRRSFGDAIVSAQIGAGQDAPERSRLRRIPLVLSRDTLLPNRSAARGSYGRVALDYEFHPDLSIGMRLTGVGAQLHYEAAAGQLAWQRATILLKHRGEWGPLVFGERVDAGIVTSPRDLPPQQLFEMGGNARLAAYSYKQFAGDRAAIATAGANYIFPRFRTLRLPGGYSRLPQLAPGIGAGVEMGWTTLTNDAARAAVLALSNPQTGVPLSVATNGIRGSAGVGVTLFSGLIHLGVAHSLDGSAKWRAAFGFGSTY